MTANSHSIAKGSRPRAVLARILDTPDLVRVVQKLEPTALARVIDAIGLEDAGEIAALMTTRQLEAVFDHDLWHAEQPGGDETFDADRFALWLSVMREAGDEFAARKLLELDEDLVTVALCQQLLVLDADQLTLEMSECRSQDDAWLEKALESSLYYELDRFFLVARNAEGFETLVQLLATLDRDHHDFVERLLERCCRLSREAIDDGGGLYEILTSQEELESDIAAARGDRREARGYVSAGDARAFLALARMTNMDELLADDDRDAITKAYFRALATEPARPASSGEAASADEEQVERLQALIEEAHPAHGSGTKRLPAPRGGSKPAVEEERRCTRNRSARQERSPAACRARRRARVSSPTCCSRAAAIASARCAPWKLRNSRWPCASVVSTASQLCDCARGSLAARIAQAWTRYSAVHAFRIGWKDAHDELTRTPGRTWTR